VSVAVYITNDRDATEVAIDTKATKEITIVGGAIQGSVAVKIVNRIIPGVQVVKIVDSRWIVQGETL
jgi:hypothetical protein